jgi:protein TonB
MLITDDITRTIKNLDVIEPVKSDSADFPDMKPEDEIRTFVEEMPMFPGGNQALLKYLSENVVYPEVSRQNNIQGKVIVKFCVTRTGGIDSVSILKGADPELDAEAIRVVKTFPPFIPGKQNGKPVPVWFIAPINFQLK